MITTVEEGPGWSIEVDDEPHTLVPYHACDHEDGRRNHGFTDIRDHPELADHIPELVGRRGLAELVKAVSEPGSALMSIGSECGLFEVDDPEPGGPTCYLGSYVDITYRDPSRNASPSTLVELARTLLGSVAVSEEHHFAFHMTVEPLRGFWGLPGRYSLMVKTAGFGRSEEQALRALDHAASAIADGCRKHYGAAAG